MHPSRPTTRASQARRIEPESLEWHQSSQHDRSAAGRERRIRDNPHIARCEPSSRGAAAEWTATGTADAPFAEEASLALESEPTSDNMVAMSIDADQHLAQQQQLEEKRQGTREQAYPATRADAALVSRGALKSGYLWKLGANVPKWKRRFFVLKPITMLFYYMSEHDTEPRGCIDLDLFDAVRKVRSDEDDYGTDASNNAGYSAAAGTSSNNARSAGKRRRASSARTAFELYRSGCPDGSGFMLEARGDEDWEQWVESIANGRHGKMLSEMEVMKGANKLLLDEISGLERQVATFRGYADQRHVTVLALRDERQRSREVAAELATLGDTASALSHLIAESLKGDHQQRQGTGDAGAADDGMATAFVAGEHGLDYSAEEPQQGQDSSTLAVVQAGKRPRPSETARNDDEHNDDGQISHSDHKELSQQVAEERASLEAVGRALVEARAEIVRRGAALQQETERRRAVEGTVQGAEARARSAEERASKAEAAEARARGRVSVLESNVDYLQTQLRTLRAQTKLIRAQKAVLKKEVRDMWTRQASSTLLRGPAGAGTAKAAHQQAAGGREGAGHSTGGWRRRTRTWASMGDLAEADVCPPSGSGGVEGGEGSTTAVAAAAEPPQRSANHVPPVVVAAGGVSTAAVFSDASGAEGGDQELGRGVCGRRPGAGMRSRVSRDSLGAASDGGETDYADRTNSEASDAGDENVRFPSDCSLGGPGSGRNSLFREGVCLSIRKRVGPPQVPSLPPSRHRRTLMAVKNLPLFDNDSNININVAAVGSIAAQRQSDRVYCGEYDDDDGSAAGNGGGTLGGAAGGGGNNGVSAAAATAGLGVAGMFLGLRKGMVDKAAQEMGKKLSLWPAAAGMAGMPSVSSLGSLAAGALSGATTSNNALNSVIGNCSSNGGSTGCDLGAGYHPQTPVGSPRSATASFSAALTDSPVRWDPSSQHGSTTSTDLGLDAGGTTGRGGEMDATAVNPATKHAFVDSLPASGTFFAGANPAGVAAAATTAGGGGLTRVSSTSSSRTPLIQLSDLELAEPCSRRIDDDSGGGGGGGGSRGSSKRLLSLLPPRPDDEYELLFTTKVIGLQFAQLPDGTGVCVSGTNGYVGPAQTGAGRIPGEKFRPDVDDVLVSYNGVSARGKSAEVVCRELAQCGRPLRLGFRSTRAEFVTDEADREGGRVVWTAAAAPRDRRPPAPPLQRGEEGGGRGVLGPRDGEGPGVSSCRDAATAFASSSQPRTVS